MVDKKIVIDADTIALRNAAFCQTNYDFINKETGECVGSFTAKKDFYEHLEENDSPDNYECVNEVRPAVPRGGDDPRIIGYHGAKMELEKIINRFPDVTDYEVCIHGQGNFRDEVATIKPYKGTRKSKPIYTQDVKDYIKNRYKEKCIVVNEEETDDYVARQGWDAFYECQDKSGYTDITVILAYIDKDIAQVPGIAYNYDKDERTHISVKDAARSFWGQMCTGDSTDNIPGIPKLSKEFRDKYGIKAARGFGVKSEIALLGECGTPKEMAERVLEAYKDAYGEEWLDIAQEVSKLLYMRREEGEMFDITKSFERLGINWEE